MSMIGFHPAPGLGELLPGWFVVPQNPLELATRGIRRIPTIGEIVPATFPVPQNPLVRALSLGASPKCLCVGIGCGDGCLSRYSGMTGLPEIWEQVKTTATGAWGSVTGMLGGANWTTYALAGGGVLLLWMLISRGGGYRREAGAARREYRARVAGLKAKYGRRYRRLAEAY